MIGGAVFTGWSWRASGRAPAQEEPAPEDVGAVLSLSASQEDMSVLLRCSGQEEGDRMGQRASRTWRLRRCGLGEAAFHSDYERKVPGVF